MNTHPTRVSRSKSSAIGFMMPLAIVTLLLAVPRGWAIVLSDLTPGAINSTAPVNDRGWKSVGAWGTSNGVAIGPHHFVTGQHIGGQSIGGTFSQNDGNNYTVTGWTNLAGSDLRVVEISGTFANYAPLWSGGSEIGQLASLIGRGRVRDSIVDEKPGSGANGWNWLDGGTQTMSWGMNVIDGTDTVNGNQEIYFDFDKEGAVDAVSDEGTYSRGDSGGGLFIYNTLESQWQLAGMGYAATTNYYTYDGSTYEKILDGAAIYDAAGLYATDSGGAAGKSIGYAHQLSYEPYADFLAPYVPEPMTISLLALGGAAVLARRRRR